MGSQLDLDDVAAQSAVARLELARLRGQLEHALAHNAAEAEDAARYRKLERAAREKLLTPGRAGDELLPDMRTHWALPVLMCSGPVGGYLSFDAAVDGLPAVGAA